jgi:hypothetical protein
MADHNAIRSIVQEVALKHAKELALAAILATNEEEQTRLKGFALLWVQMYQHAAVSNDETAAALYRDMPALRQRASWMLTSCAPYLEQVQEYDFMTVLRYGPPEQPEQLAQEGQPPAAAGPP